jgi:hypothetical protein
MMERGGRRGDRRRAERPPSESSEAGRRAHAARGSAGSAWEESPLDKKQRAPQSPPVSGPVPPSRPHARHPWSVPPGGWGVPGCRPGREPGSDEANPGVREGMKSDTPDPASEGQETGPQRQGCPQAAQAGCGVPPAPGWRMEMPEMNPYCYPGPGAAYGPERAPGHPNPYAGPEYPGLPCGSHAHGLPPYMSHPWAGPVCNEHPSMGHPYAGPAYPVPYYRHPYWGHPYGSHPYFGHPYFAQPNFGQPCSVQPHYGQPSYGQLYCGQPHYGHSHPGNPYAGQPHAGGPWAWHPYARYPFPAPLWMNPAYTGRAYGTWPVSWCDPWSSPNQEHLAA